VLGREEIVVAMARTDPLAAEAEGVTFALIAGEPVVHYHPDNGLGGWLDDVAAQRDVRLTAATRTRQATTAAHLAAAGLGVALVPTTAVHASFPRVARSLRAAPSSCAATCATAPAWPAA
jgi:DNA-binding transcriptional LysR family regulator